MSTSDSKHIGLAFVVSIPMTVIQLIWGGFVIMVLWGWFIVPTFVNVPSLGLAQAIGVDLVFSMFLLRRIAATNKEEGVWMAMLQSFFYTVFMGALLLVMGLIVHAFM